RQQHVAGLRLELPAEAMDQPVERREQQRERRAQFVADVREEAALHLVQLDELAVVFLDDLPVALAFEAQVEFAETQTAVSKAAGDDDDAGDDQKINVVDQKAQFLVRLLKVILKEAGAEIHQDHEGDREDVFLVAPGEDQPDRQENNVEAGVVQ